MKKELSEEIFDQIQANASEAVIKATLEAGGGAYECVNVLSCVIASVLLTLADSDPDRAMEILNDHVIPLTSSIVELARENFDDAFTIEKVYTKEPESGSVH